jgi:hypothetical protein
MCKYKRIFWITAMNAEQLALLKNENYEWLCAQASDQKNDVSADYESSDPNVDAEALVIGAREVKLCRSFHSSLYKQIETKQKHKLKRSEYVVIRAYAAKSGFAMIKGSEVPRCDVINTRTYDAFILDSMDDNDETFASREPTAISEISSAIETVSGISAIIWHYAREPICMVTIHAGGSEILTLPVYEFPFTGFPKDPIPRKSCVYHSIRIKTQPELRNILIKRRNIMFKNEGRMDDFTKLSYIKGYDVVTVAGMWMPGRDWRETH